MLRTALGVILQREALRQSRRWQTYAMRFLFSAMLLGAVYLSLRNTLIGYDVGSLGWIGRRLFNLYTAVQLGTAAIMAPLLVASGILEEREAKTLDLLAISGLSPLQILWGKVGSRLLVLLSTVAAGMPVLGLILTFGGVSPWEVVNVTANTALLATVLGVVGGFCALFAKKGPLAALFGAFLFVFPTLAILPYAYDALGHYPAAPYHLSPLMAFGADNPFGLLPLLAYVPVIWQTMALALPVFRIATSDEATESFGFLSTDFWVLERFRRGTWQWMAGTVALFAVYAGFWSLEQDAGWGVPGEAVAAVTWVLAVIVLYSWTRFFLMTWIWGAQHAARYLQLTTEGFFRPRPRRQREVWGNPVAWREIGTRANGGTRLWLRGLTVLWLLWVAMVLFSGGWGDWEMHAALASMGVIGGWCTALLIATATVVEERQGNTLPLLLLSPMSPLRIAWGKLQAVWFRAAPLVFLGLGLHWLAPSNPHSDHDRHHHIHGDNVLSGVVGAEGLALVAWVFSALSVLALLAILCGLLVRPVRLAWPATVFCTLAWFGLPFAAAIAVDYLDLAEIDFSWWATLWVPLFDDGALFCADGGTPVAVLAGTWIQVVLAAVLFGLVAWRLERMPSR